MPLPKPSKTVSKRIKKPKPLLFSFPQPERLNLDKPTKLPRERRVRVICTDPDATDSSSDEETVDAPLRQKLAAGKRLVHEICLPASPPIFSGYQQEGICISPGLARESGFKHAKREAALLEFCEKANVDDVGASAGDTVVRNVSSGRSGVGLQEFCKGTNADDMGACAGDAVVQHVSSGYSGVGLWGYHERTNVEDVGVCAGDTAAQNVSSGCSGVSLRDFDVGTCSGGTAAKNVSGMEEYTLFLSEFFTIPEEGGIPAWDEELDLLDEETFNMPNFDLDFESTTWMNSVPTFV